MMTCPVFTIRHFSRLSMMSVEPLSSRVIFQEVCVVSDLSLSSGGSPNDYSVVHPLVLLVASLNFHMEMEPILAGIDWPSLHQRLQHLWRPSSRTLCPVLILALNRKPLEQDEPPTEYRETRRHHF